MRQFLFLGKFVNTVYICDFLSVFFLLENYKLFLLGKNVVRSSFSTYFMISVTDANLPTHAEM